MATYLIALVPNWIEIAKKADLPEKWLRGLESSPIGDFGIKEGRIGALVDFSQSVPDLRQLVELIRKRIPFWIFWGDGKTYEPPLHDKLDVRFAELLRPNNLEVDWAMPEINLVSSLPSFPSFPSSTSFTNDLWDYELEHLVPLPNPDPDEKHPTSLSAGITSENARANNEANKALSSKGFDLPPIEPYSGLVQIQPGQVEKGSRQVPFESPETFWARQHAEDEENLSKMTEAERKRLRNERDAYHITKKSTVFHWEKFSWGRIRRRVAKKDYEDYRAYPLTQTRFSLTRNEWDVCTEFDADAEAPLTFSDDDDSCDFPKIKRHEREAENRSVVRDDQHTEYQRPLSSSIEEGEIVEEGEIIERYDEDNLLESDGFPMHGECTLPDEVVLTEKRFQEALKDRYYIRPDVDVRDLHNVSLVEMLYYRYGLLLNNVRSISSLNRSSVSDGTAEDAWATTRGILYDVESSAECFSLQEMLGITQVVQSLLDSRLVRANLLDIHPDNLKTPLGTQLRDVASLLKIKENTFNGIVYLRSIDQTFAVALVEPSLVVEVLRRAVSQAHEGRFDVFALLKLFAERGSPFRTLHLVREPTTKSEPLLWDLGFRSLDEPPGPFAYAQYEKLLQVFMRQSRARCVFGLGGPVWRAIMEVLGFDLGTFDLTGPYERISTTGQSFVFSDGQVLWEDGLTESELLFLCGTYKVRKGQDTMLYSWWPSPKQWDSATSNVRYWSPGNERWFTSRLHDIRRGRTSWIHMPKWPQRLKTNKKTKRLMDKNNVICSAFLESIV
ncbi:hypothetical protein ACEPAG_3744 [Sanghuangporus baumii]